MLVGYTIIIIIIIITINYKCFDLTIYCPFAVRRKLTVFLFISSLGTLLVTFPVAREVFASSVVSSTPQRPRQYRRDCLYSTRCTLDSLADILDYGHIIDVGPTILTTGTS